MRRHNDKGFSLVELLVVIGVLAVLSVLITAGTLVARKGSKKAAARTEIQLIKAAIVMLERDTEKWPNGCSPGESANPEVNLNTAQAALLSAPTVGDQGDGCEWTAEDVAAWDGPYFQDALVDPWENDYWFDPDYTPYQNCADEDTIAQSPAIISFGENGEGLNVYDCDDIFLILD